MVFPSEVNADIKSAHIFQTKCIWIKMDSHWESSQAETHVV